MKPNPNVRLLCVVVAAVAAVVALLATMGHVDDVDALQLTIAAVLFLCLALVA